MEQEKRGQWASNFGFLMAAVGSAVGLGNIWGFPYKMGASGGFAFLVIYLILVAFVGVATMLGELALGRKYGMGVVGTYRLISKKYTWIGWLGFLSGFFILAFYSVLGGYTLRYTIGFIMELFSAGSGFGLRFLYCKFRSKSFVSLIIYGNNHHNSYGRNFRRH